MSVGDGVSVIVDEGVLVCVNVGEEVIVGVRVIVGEGVLVLVSVNVFVGVLVQLTATAVKPEAV
jgi:hypothetical protein